MEPQLGCRNIYYTLFNLQVKEHQFCFFFFLARRLLLGLWASEFELRLLLLPVVVFQDTPVLEGRFLLCALLLDVGCIPFRRDASMPDEHKPLAFVERDLGGGIRTRTAICFWKGEKQVRYCIKNSENILYINLLKNLIPFIAGDARSCFPWSAWSMYSTHTITDKETHIKQKFGSQDGVEKPKMNPGLTKDSHIKHMRTSLLVQNWMSARGLCYK